MDNGNKAIRKIAPDGEVSTLVSGISGEYLAVDNSGNCYVAGMGSLYRISLNGVVTEITAPIFFGSGYGGLAVDSQGNIYTKLSGDTGEVVKITPQ
jgi:hypothetical protein